MYINKTIFTIHYILSAELDSEARKKTISCQMPGCLSGDLGEMACMQHPINQGDTTVL